MAFIIYYLGKIISFSFDKVINDDENVWLILY